MSLRGTRTIAAGALLWLAACSPPEGGPSCPDPPSAARDAALPAAAVRYLADSTLEGRRAGTRGELCAREYLAAEFRRLGLAPLGDDGTYFQELLVPDPFDPYETGGVGFNVIGHLPGRDPALRHEAVVVGAHYDHLGTGGRGSLAPEAEGEIHHGADDNASGVAALVLVARRLARDPPARSVVFVAFSGEELGLLGSLRYTAHPPVPLEQTRAMLNLDMVGRLAGRALIVNGAGTAEEWPRILEKANRDRLPLDLRPQGYGPSDHASFYAARIPVLHFYTGMHDDYHRPSDTWERLDLRGVARVARFAERVAREVADRPAPLTLVRGMGRPRRLGGPARADSSPAGRGARKGGDDGPR